VTFPDDYPNSVRHFLLIGFLGMFIGAIVFFYMGISRKVNTVMHVLTFFIAAVSACAYYAEWAGLGVEYKTTDTTPRVIFWAHYLDWVITGPVRFSLFFVFKFHMPEIYIQDSARHHSRMPHFWLRGACGQLGVTIYKFERSAVGCSQACKSYRSLCYGIWMCWRTSSNSTRMYFAICDLAVGSSCDRSRTGDTWQ